MDRDRRQRSNDVYYAALPRKRGDGEMISPFTVGGSMVVMPKFSASRHWDIVNKYRVTSFGSVATMLALLNQRIRIVCRKDWICRV